MELLLIALGRLAGVAGAVVCGVAGVARVAGAHWLSGFQVTTLLQVGVALMVLGCLSFLAVLLERVGEREP